MRTLLLLILTAAAFQSSDNPRPRARDLGIAPGVFPPGPLNAITDVRGVRVGQTTIVEGDNVRTGVTAILPHGGNVFQDKVTGPVFVGNAFGKLAGSPQARELGTIETPIVLTNTLSVGTAVEAVVAWTLAQPGNERVQSVNALVGETNDGGLNDIRGMHVKREHVMDAIRRAAEGPVEEGSLGAGTGTICFGWKGGIGTSSRVLPSRSGGYTLGVLVQTNFGGVLTMGGAPLGKELGKYAFQGSADPGAGDGSCMIVVATDAPLDARDLGRLAARAVYGLARNLEWLAILNRGDRTPARRRSQSIWSAEACFRFSEPKLASARPQASLRQHKAAASCRTPKKPLLGRRLRRFLHCRHCRRLAEDAHQRRGQTFHRAAATIPAGNQNVRHERHAAHRQRLHDVHQ